MTENNYYDCKYIISWYPEGDYCTKEEHLFLDFEGYNDYCEDCPYFEARKKIDMGDFE